MSTSIPSTPGIYKIVNTTNGHFYVGSAVNLAQRKRQHFSDLKLCKHGNSHLQRAYDRYGANAFCFEILEHVDHVENLLVREQHYIDTLNPHYNIARIAGNNFGMKHSPETISRISAIKREQSSTPEFRERMSILQKGKKLSPEHIAKRTASRDSF